MGDCDDSGYITSDNLRHFLDEKNYNDDEINIILNEADLNQDGKVSFEDFLEMFSSSKNNNNTENEARNEVRRKCNNSKSFNYFDYSNNNSTTISPTSNKSYNNQNVGYDFEGDL